MIELLPFNYLKIGSVCEGCKYQVEKSVLFPVTRSYDVWWQSNRLVSGGQVLNEVV